MGGPARTDAFTNYLAQSLIFGWAFYGYGFGFFGRLGASTALAFGVAVYGAQVIFSRWWLTRYNFGPVEWLWRTLMYGHLQPETLDRACLSAAKRSEAGDAAVQIVFVRSLDPGGDDLADPQRTTARDVDRAVDLRRVRLGAAF